MDKKCQVIIAGDFTTADYESPSAKFTASLNKKYGHSFLCEWPFLLPRILFAAAEYRREDFSIMTNC